MLLGVLTMVKGNHGGRGRSLTESQWIEILSRRAERPQPTFPELEEEYGISAKSIKLGLKRIRANGTARPKHGPSKKRGGRPRNTNWFEDAGMVTYMLNNRGKRREVPRREIQKAKVPRVWKAYKAKEPDPVTGVVATVVKYGWRFKIDERGVGRRLQKAGYRCYHPAVKEQYNEEECQERVEYSVRGCLAPPGYWENVVMTDEVKLTWARGAALRKLQGSRVRFVWRRRGERFHPDCIKPHASYLDGVHIKFFVALQMGGGILVCEDSTPYREFSQTAKKNLDQNSYAKYLEHLDGQVRFWNNELGDDASWRLLQDNCSWHDAPAARKACRDFKIQVIPGQPSRSPDLNPIENVFALLVCRLDQLYLSPAKDNASVEEFRADVMNILIDLQLEGHLARICSPQSMQNRMVAVIQAGGHATHY